VTVRRGWEQLKHAASAAAIGAWDKDQKPPLAPALLQTATIDHTGSVSPAGQAPELSVETLRSSSKMSANSGATDSRLSRELAVLQCNRRI
jgi:hypothetical protein